MLLLGLSTGNKSKHILKNLYLVTHNGKVKQIIKKKKQKYHVFMNFCPTSIQDLWSSHLTQALTKADCSEDYLCLSIYIFKVNLLFFR